MVSPRIFTACRVRTRGLDGSLSARYLGSYLPADSPLSAGGGDRGARGSDGSPDQLNRFVTRFRPIDIYIHRNIGGRSFMSNPNFHTTARI